MALAELVPELASPLADPEAGGTFAVDLAAIEANWQVLTQKLLTVECAAVVKANAYGLGIDAVTAKLAAAGCKTFFVADVAEARRVRARAREATIYVLDGFAPDAAAAFVEINARPVINSIAELAEWDAFVGASRWQGGAAFHVDTGMNRLGMTEVEVAALAPRLEHENHGVMLLMSHLACAEVPDHPLNAAQIQRFRDLHRLYPGVPASLANSSGIFLGAAAHFDLARPGAALYGINPTPGHQNPMQGVVELTGPILQIRNIEPGETVGYGATWTAKRASRLAVIGLGYADGVLRAASAGDRHAGGAAIIAGRRCPFAGRISMDLVCVDITDLPDGAARRRDLATVIGPEIPIDEFAASAGTIGYEILTRLGRNRHRVYRGG
jgi:alanine racemase